MCARVGGETYWSAWWPPSCPCAETQLWNDTRPDLYRALVISHQLPATVIATWRNRPPGQPWICQSAFACHVTLKVQHMATTVIRIWQRGHDGDKYMATTVISS